MRIKPSMAEEVELDLSEPEEDLLESEKAFSATAVGFAFFVEPVE